jgi:multicomponent Na+:H+ antiporter subunit D
LNTVAWLPPAILFSSLIPGLVIFFLGEEQQRTRIALNLGGAVLKLGLVGLLTWGVSQGVEYEARFALAPGMDLVLHADALSMLFVALSTGLWLLTTVYAVGYLEDSPHRSRFFGFFSLCASATVGIAMAGNMLTFFVFYELLTLSTFPLVVHRGTPEALRGGIVYLAYTMIGGAVLLAGIAWLRALVGPLDFTETGLLAGRTELDRDVLTVIFVMLVAGLGVKAALVPLHGWLPKAMVAPAPVSALLHAVAVVKAGAFGIVRVVYDVYGLEFSADLGVLLPLALVASLTIVYGSLRALAQDELKKRLAYSTVSQVSYIALGTALFGPIASIGGLVHLVHQGVMKITLFFCAGNYAETLGIHHVSEMHGVGRRMPWTTAAFTVGALGMIGVPPTAGFISKWYLGSGALAADQGWVLWVLAASGLLNAAYFLPVVYRAWFLQPAADWPAERRFGRLETHWMLLLPTLLTALLAVLIGLLASVPYSALEWARLIAFREYVR